MRDTMQARQAALLLHGLSPDARRQVVANLNDAELLRLQPLLAELTAMGVSHSVGQQLYALLPAQSDESSSTQAQLQRFDAGDIAQSLESCAPVTVAHLLQAGTWPWRTQVLDRMSGARRADVSEHMRGDASPLAPAVLRFFCERLRVEAARASAKRLNVIESRTLAGKPGRWVGLNEIIRSAPRKWFAWTL